MDRGPSHLKRAAVGETVPGERQGTGKGLGEEQGGCADWAPVATGKVAHGRRGGLWGGPSRTLLALFDF